MTMTHTKTKTFDKKVMMYMGILPLCCALYIRTSIDIALHLKVTKTKTKTKLDIVNSADSAFFLLKFLSLDLC